jgi:pyruvate ferredoxin oxidoreductase beta subunit/2-oxoisovalerate ferredoxin oxidoreductase beta subunit
MSVALQALGRVLQERPIQMVIPACCGIVTAGPFPFSAYGVPVVAATFASAAAVATGLAHVARLNGDPTRVLCWAGDGGTYDIGLATLSAAAERNEDVLYICYDNEIYGNTGGQRSSATPTGAVTTTTPSGKEAGKKDILGILAAHRIPYTATISLAHREDMEAKMARAVEERGFRFLHVLSPCPTGWKSEPSEGIELVRLAVRSGLFPVLEIEDGDRVRVSVEPELESDGLEEYFERQGRFAGTGLDLDRVKADIAANWRRIRARSEAPAPAGA